jgi:hypothetical protein
MYNYIKSYFVNEIIYLKKMKFNINTFNYIIKQNKIKKYSTKKNAEIQQGVKLLLFLILVVKLILT